MNWRGAVPQGRDRHFARQIDLIERVEIAGPFHLVRLRRAQIEKF